MMTCPEGHPLEPNSVGAPWICRQCVYRFWNCELTPEAKKLWRPKYKDFGIHSPLAELVAQEQEGKK